MRAFLFISNKFSQTHQAVYVSNRKIIQCFTYTFYNFAVKVMRMDVKVTLSFRKDVVDKAKRFAAKNNISLSRLTEFLYSKITSENYKSLEELPVADWVMMVAEGEAEYVKKQKKNKELKKEFYNARK